MPHSLSYTPVPDELGAPDDADHAVAPHPVPRSYSVPADSAHHIMPHSVSYTPDDALVPVPRSYSVDLQQYSGPTGSMPSTRMMTANSNPVHGVHARTPTSSNGSRIYRHNSSRSWKVEDLDALELEMAEQLLSLKQTGTRSMDALDHVDHIENHHITIDIPLPTMRTVFESESRTVTQNGTQQLGQMTPLPVSSGGSTRGSTRNESDGDDEDVETTDNGDDSSVADDTGNMSPFEAQREMEEIRKQMLHLAAMEMVSSVAMSDLGTM